MSVRVIRGSSYCRVENDPRINRTNKKILNPASLQTYPGAERTFDECDWLCLKDASNGCLRKPSECRVPTVLLEETATYKLTGKTGAAPLAKGGTLAWFVGYLEREGNVYFFALNIDGVNYEAIREERIDLTKRILTELGYLPK